MWHVFERFQSPGSLPSISRSYHARLIVPVDRPPLEGGAVVVAGDRIASVESTRRRGTPSTDLGDVALLPGLINAHTHLEFSGLAAPHGRPGTSLPDWIRGVIETRRRTEDGAAAIRAGIQESLEGGVTTLADMATAPIGAYPHDSNRPRVQLFHEVIAFSRARADSAVTDTLRRLADPSSGIAADSDALFLSAGICPHAPYTVSERLVERLVELAAAENRSVAMHLAESPEELQLLAEGSGPFRELLEERSMWDAAAIRRDARPLDYLERLARAPRALVVHGNFLTPQEHDALARHRDRMSLVYCPRTHAFFGHPRYPLPDALRRGVRVVVGTDSRASSPDLSLWEEVRAVRREFAGLDPCKVIAMATADSAEALGLRDAGTLGPGKRADMLAARLPADSGKHPLDALLANPLEVAGVWVGGQQVC